MTDLSRLCRVCAEVASPAISLLDPRYQQFNKEAFLTLEIDSRNGFPTNICPTCLKTTNNWLALKHTCVTSQKYFSTLLGVTSSDGSHSVDNSINVASCHKRTENSTDTTGTYPENVTKGPVIRIKSPHSMMNTLPVSAMQTSDIRAKTSRELPELVWITPESRLNSLLSMGNNKPITTLETTQTPDIRAETSRELSEFVRNTPEGVIKTPEMQSVVNSIPIKTTPEVSVKTNILSSELATWTPDIKAAMSKELTEPVRVSAEGLMEAPQIRSMSSNIPKTTPDNKLNASKISVKTPETNILSSLLATRPSDIRAETSGELPVKATPKGVIRTPKMRPRSLLSMGSNIPTTENTLNSLEVSVKTLETIILSSVPETQNPPDNRAETSRELQELVKVIPKSVIKTTESVNKNPEITVRSLHSMVTTPIIEISTPATQEIVSSENTTSDISLKTTESVLTTPEVTSKSRVRKIKTTENIIETKNIDIQTRKIVFKAPQNISKITENITKTSEVIDMSDSDSSDDDTPNNTVEIFSDNLNSLDKGAPTITEDSPAANTSRKPNKNNSLLVEESVKNSKSQKRELRVVLTRIDVEKYNSTLKRKKFNEGATSEETVLTSVKESNISEPTTSKIIKTNLTKIMTKTSSVCRKHSNSSSNASKTKPYPKKAKYTCSLCRFSTTDAETIQEHLGTHASLRFHCSSCNAHFHLQGSLNEHIRLNHPSFNMFVCSKCGRCYDSKYELLKHEYYIHQVGYLCKECGNFFITEDLFTDHILSTQHNHAYEPRFEHLNITKELISDLEQESDDLETNTLDIKCENISAILEKYSKVKKEIKEEMPEVESQIHTSKDSHSFAEICNESSAISDKKEGIVLPIEKIYSTLISDDNCEVSTTSAEFSENILCEDNRSVEPKEEILIDELNENGDNDEIHSTIISDDNCETPEQNCKVSTISAESSENILCEENQSVAPREEIITGELSANGDNDDSTNKESSMTICRICNLKVDNSDVESHVSSHIYKGGRCQYCNECFATPQLLHIHEKWLHSMNHKCPSCSLTFKTERLLQLHESYEHGSNSILSCKNCGKCYLKDINLAKHEETNKCLRGEFAMELNLIMSNKFRQASSQQSSQADSATVSPTVLSCPSCNRKFIYGETFKKHKCSDTAEELFDCVHCEIKFYSLNTLRQHITQHHPHTFSYCSSRGSAVKSKRRGFYVTKRCICNDCGKTVAENNLKRHLKTCALQRPSSKLIASSQNKQSSSIPDVPLISNVVSYNSNPPQNSSLSPNSFILVNSPQIGGNSLNPTLLSSEGSNLRFLLPPSIQAPILPTLGGNSNTIYLLTPQSNTPHSTAPESIVPQLNIRHSIAPQSNLTHSIVPQSNIPHSIVPQCNMPHLIVTQSNIRHSILPQSNLPLSSNYVFNSVPNSQITYTPSTVTCPSQKLVEQEDLKPFSEITVDEMDWSKVPLVTAVQKEMVSRFTTGGTSILSSGVQVNQPSSTSSPTTQKKMENILTVILN